MSRLDFFYCQEAEQFTFYRIPKQLLSDARFRHISTDAKLLYGLMLDRMGLSLLNKWVDDLGRVYIFYTVKDAEEQLWLTKAIWAIPAAKTRWQKVLLACNALISFFPKTWACRGQVPGRLGFLRKNHQRCAWRMAKKRAGTVRSEFNERDFQRYFQDSLRGRRQQKPIGF